jgi:TatD family-associated radical SAM protein
MDNYTYGLEGKLYINLTNRCSNRCTFCVRNGLGDFNGYDLFLSREPSADEVLAAIDNPQNYREIVFCGYGEPSYRLDVLISVANVLKKHGVPLRLNTNGQAELILGREVADELSACIDTVSISLNATNAEAYQSLCNSEFGDRAFPAVLKFARSCKNAGMEVFLSVVDILSDEEIAEAKNIAEACGVEFKVRKLIAPANI